MLEANVDDLTGELAGHAIQALLAAGALDAWAVPITMKKGRPGLVVSALVRAPEAERLSAVVLRETTSLGVRKLAADRLERPRREVIVETRFGLIPLKIAEGPYGPPQAKPEFDACERAANQAGVGARGARRRARGLGTTNGRSEINPVARWGARRFPGEQSAFEKRGADALLGELRGKLFRACRPSGSRARAGCRAS